MNLFIHGRMGHFLQNEAGAEGGDGGGGQQQADASLLNQGAQTPIGDVIPEKYRVNGADGALDLDASSRKLAESYAHLEKRMGSGDVPPKSAEEYAPKIEAEGFNWDEFKADPEAQEFLKGAHAKGLTNGQIEYVLGQYLGHMPGLLAGNQQLDQQAAGDALRGEWKTDAEFQTNLRSSFRAAQAFGGEQGLGNFATLQAKFGNDPDFIAFTARIGREMQEDTPAGGEAPLGDGDFNVQASELRKQLESLQLHDPKRAQVQQQLNTMYERRFSPKRAAALTKPA